MPLTTERNRAKTIVSRFSLPQDFNLGCPQPKLAQTTFPGVVNESGPQLAGLTEIEQCLKANAAFSF